MATISTSTAEASRGRLLAPGETCWQVTRAQRLSLIQDAGPTFAAIASALEAAQRTIFILGWDLDSRTVLRPGATDPAARTLLPLLSRCLQRRPDLQIFVLIWDFSIIWNFSFVLGNIVGALPGLLGLGIVVDRLVAVPRRPSAFNVAAAIALLALATVVGVFFRRRLIGNGRARDVAQRSHG